MSELLQQRMSHIEENQKLLQEEVKELNRRMNTHDTSAARIELIVEGMKTDWVALKADIQRMIENQNNANTTTTTTFATAFQNITMELIKTVGLIVAAFLAAKTFFT